MGRRKATRKTDPKKEANKPVRRSTCLRSQVAPETEEPEPAPQAANFIINVEDVTPEQVPVTSRMFASKSLEKKKHKRLERRLRGRERRRNPNVEALAFGLSEEARMREIYGRQLKVLTELYQLEYGRGESTEANSGQDQGPSHLDDEDGKKMGFNWKWITPELLWEFLTNTMELIKSLEKRNNGLEKLLEHKNSIILYMLGKGDRETTEAEVEEVPAPEINSGSTKQGVPSVSKKIDQDNIVPVPVVEEIPAVDSPGEQNCETENNSAYRLMIQKIFEKEKNETSPSSLHKSVKYNVPRETESVQLPLQAEPEVEGSKTGVTPTDAADLEKWRRFELDIYYILGNTDLERSKSSDYDDAMPKPPKAGKIDAAEIHGKKETETNRKLVNPVPQPSTSQLTMLKGLPQANFGFSAPIPSTSQAIAAQKVKIGTIPINHSSTRASSSTSVNAPRAVWSSICGVGAYLPPFSAAGIHHPPTPQYMYRPQQLFHYPRGAAPLSLEALRARFPHLRLNPNVRSPSMTSYARTNFTGVSGTSFRLPPSNPDHQN